MQRITIEKNEAVADLVERILEAQDHEVILVVPKGSKLLESISNFRLIAREAKVLAKNVVIESVDQEVLMHAKAAGIPANHPLFSEQAKVGTDNQSFSDILPRGSKKKTVTEKKLKVVEEEPEAYEEEEEQEEIISVSRDIEEDTVERYDTLEEPRSRSGGKKLVVWGIITLVVIGLLMWISAAAFGKTTVTLTFQKSPWNFDGTVTASVATKEPDATTATIPAEFVEQAQSLPSRSFPATGHTSGGQKARGTITIVNEYSSASQELVATTRFTSPDGKIYRLDAGIIIPGATVGADGKVTASSSIKAAVTADQPGSDYNTGRIDRLTIPGFQGTPKAKGFYGILLEGASGGSSTGGASPTDTDIKNAKSQMSADLTSGSQAKFLATVPADFKVLPQAVVFSSTTFSIGPVDAQSQFSLTPSTIFRAFEFREKDLIALLNAKVASTDPDKLLQNLTLDYSNVSPNFTKKQMTFTLNAKGTVVPKFDPIAFAAGLAGKSEKDAKQAIMELPFLEDAQISLWPAWRWTLPTNSSKIDVKIQ